MKRPLSKTQYITEARLGEILDQKLDEKLDEKLDKKLDEKLDQKLAEFFGKMVAYFDKQFEERNKKLDKDIEVLSRMADAAEKRIERVDHESVALGAQVDRHEVWLQRVTDTASRSI